jgi:hypothetical protein
MMTLENVLEMWKKDSLINENELDAATVETSKLHPKYLEFYSIAKLQLKRNESKLDELKKVKWMYFTGKMSKTEMDDREWPYDPFDGVKALKSDMELYYNADKDIINAKSKIEYSKALVELLEEIISTLRWRHQSIRNMLEFRKFTSGM